VKQTEEVFGNMSQTLKGMIIHFQIQAKRINIIESQLTAEAFQNNFFSTFNFFL
jgi:hypothetical protein